MKMVADFEREFPAGVELLVAVMSFQKIHSLRADAVQALSELMMVMSEHKQVPVTVRIIAYLVAARDVLAKLLSMLHRSTEIERAVLAAMLSMRFSGRLPRPCEIRSPAEIAEQLFMLGNRNVRTYWVLLHG